MNKWVMYASFFVGFRWIIVGSRRQLKKEVSNKNDRLYIYAFKSIGQRRKTIDPYSTLQKKLHLHNMMTTDYKAWNIFMFRTIQFQNNSNSKTMSPESPIKLRPIVFKDLNQGKTVVFAGAFKHWQGQVTLKYYQHFFKNTQGLLDGENSSRTSNRAKYTGKTINNVGPVSFHYKTSTGDSSGKTTLDGHGYLLGGGGGGGGAIPDKDKEITMTIQWNGLKENIHMKPLPKGQTALIPEKRLPQKQGKYNLIYAANKGKGNEVLASPAFLQKALNSSRVLETAHMMHFKQAQTTYPSLQIKNCFIFLDYRGIALKTNDIKKAQAFLNDQTD